MSGRSSPGGHILQYRKYRFRNFSNEAYLRALNASLIFSHPRPIEQLVFYASWH